MPDPKTDSLVHIYPAIYNKLSDVADKRHISTATLASELLRHITRDTGLFEALVDEICRDPYQQGKD